MKFVWIFSVFLCVIIVSSVGAYRILGVFPVTAYSHYVLGSRLMKGLAEKGHDVTIIAPFKDNDPPRLYREIVLEEVLEQSKGKKFHGN